MSPAEHNPHDFGAAPRDEQRAKSDQSIETIYTTVEVQRDRTDWLTVVSNLRQINRQLVEEIARLEEALASAKQTQHTHKEANQTYEITILQQQDELRISHDRVGALFQQLETSHQIGQRQQTLIETLSQQLEIVQTIVPQLEAENEQLRQKYQHQSQKLIKTEQVALELHRRLKLQATPSPAPTRVKIASNPASAKMPQQDRASTETIAAAQLRSEREAAARPSDVTTEIACPDLSLLETATFDSTTFTAEIDPAPPLAPPEIPQTEIPNWNPSAPTLARTTISSPSKPSAPPSWREVFASNNSAHRHNPTPNPVPSSPLRAPDPINPQTPSEDPTTTSSPNWPAPTVNRGRSIAKTVKIDLPKFPKKQD